MSYLAPRPSAAVEIAAAPITIGVAARRTGLTPRAIRLYEQKGFISPRRDDYDIRFYDRATVERLRHIALLRCADLSLKDIATALDALDRHGLAAMRRCVLDLLARRSEILEGQRRRVESIRLQLQAIA